MNKPYINLHTAMLLTLLALVAGVGSAQAFSFDDMERMEQFEQQELLDLAKQAARSWNFSAARNYLEQARNKGFSPNDVEAARRVYQSEYAAYEEKQRREEQERLARAEAERQRASGGSGGRKLASNVSGSFSGRCPSSGYHDRAKYNIRFTDGGHGTLVVRCERGCWSVQIFPGPTATNCGEFGSGSWAGTTGNLNRYGASLNDVAHWMMR